MMHLSILLSAVFFAVAASGSPKFMIKHKMSGKWVHPLNSFDPIPDNDHLIIWSDYHDKIYMTFEIIDGEWGYIRHIDSGKIFNPYLGSMTPSDNTNVVLHSDHEPYAYFALDQINNHIIHHGGKYMHTNGDEAYPANKADIILRGDVHEGMEFELVNPYLDEIVYPYGDAHIAGEWRLVFIAEHPLATDIKTFEVAIGKSHTESTSSSFRFVWEVSAGAQFWFAQMSILNSLSAEIQQSSSDTWTAEITTTYSVEVVEGASVAVWQKDFIGEQLGHKAFHRSNMFAYTEGPNSKPGDTAPIKYRFI